MKRQNERMQSLHSMRCPSAKMEQTEKTTDKLLLSSSGILGEQVTSVYDRLQAREALGRQQQQQLEETWKTPPLRNGRRAQEKTSFWKNKMSARLGDPIVPLHMLERMQIVFILYGKQQQRKKRTVLPFDDSTKREEEEMNEFEAMIHSREQELDRQEVPVDGSAPLHASGNDLVLGGAGAKGIPFPVFERFIVEPYFDALFPPAVPSTHAVGPSIETSDGCLSSFELTAKSSWSFAGRPRTRTRFLYQRRRESHVEAAENLFSVMDTNGDGFLSWDEFSSYILQSGQQLLLKSQYGRGGTAREKDGSAENVAGRCLNFTPTPLNVNLWQQQYPLVHHLYHSEPISRLIFSNSGRRYITAAWDGLVKVWRPNPRLADAYGKPSIVHECTIFAAGAPIIDLVLSPASLGDAEVLAVVCMDGTVTLLRAGTGEVLKTFIGRCSIPPNVGSHFRPKLRTCTQVREFHVKNANDLPLTEQDINGTVETGAVVLRPTFKVRAYRREAIEMFFTEVSRYFTGLSVVAPTYEHLERRHHVMADVLLHFGDALVTPMNNKLSPHHTFFGLPKNGTRDAKKATDNAEARATHDASQLGTDDAFVLQTGEATASASLQPRRQKQWRQHQLREVQTPTTAVPRSSSLNYSDVGDNESNKCWFARSAAFAQYKRANSASVLPSGVFLLLGFETGVLQFYSLHSQLFAISNIAMARLEVPSMHEPVLALKLHRGSITSILTSEMHDLLMTASDDGTVILRHISRICVPFLTLGDGVPLPGRPLPFHPSGHTKRITCICWHSVRGIIATGGADRIVNFWASSSSRPLYRIDLRIFSTSSGTSGTPIDVSFIQPPRYPLLLLVLDTRRMLYFIDTVSYQCLHMLRDDGLTSLKAGDMLCARYDVVDGRLILGGRHVRAWDIRQTDEYPGDYCGHRRAVVGLVYQRTFGFWVSADDSVVIIWNAKMVDMHGECKGSFKKEAEEGGEGARRRRSIDRERKKGFRWVLQSDVVRYWTVEGGIFCLAVEQSELSHVFVALLRERRILEYNSFSGSVLRAFDFPGESGEICSLACGRFNSKASFMHPVAFLCGTFEREQSSNGTTALYMLTSDSDVIAAADSSSSVHRSIVTTGVGVSCAVIVAALGLVVVGHRGGISVTPVDEATTCPIACTRLTDVPQKRRPHGKGGKKNGVTALSESRRVTPPHPTPTAASVTSLISGEKSGQLNKRHVLGLSSLQQRRQTQQRNSICRLAPPLDLVALLPGPLLQDPVSITRECMQQRERYLFYNERQTTASAGNPLKITSDTVASMEEEEYGEKRNSNSDELPPLLLFSDAFISSSPAFAGSFGLLLREQLAARGYVGHIVPVAETGYAVTGSDDGVVQLWNLRTLSEVMRYRATYALDAITAMEVSEDAAYLAVGDTNGHILLLDMHEISWDSAIPLEMVTGIENGVHVLHRWRGHRHNVTSVQFVRREGGMVRRSAAYSYTVHRNTTPRTPLRQVSGLDFSAANNNTTDENVASRNYSSRDVFFLCTSGEDSYVYAWSWEAEPRGGGSVNCIGCFGGGVELPPTPPVDELTDSAWQVLEVVRKVYIEERLMSAGGALSGPNVEGAIPTAVLEIMEDMQSVKSAVMLLRRGAAAMGKRLVSLSTLLRARERSRVQCTSPSFVSSASEPCPPTYVLAFEEGLYYDRGIVELLERVLTGMQEARTRRKSIMQFPVCRANLIGSKRLLKPPRQTAIASQMERSLAEDETPLPTTVTGTLDITTRGAVTGTDPTVVAGMRFVTSTPVVGTQAPTCELPTKGAVVKDSGSEPFMFPSPSASNVFQPTLPSINASQGSQYRLFSSTLPLTTRTESISMQTNGGNWAQLPSITVHFATPSPLPRLQHVDKNAAEAGVGYNTKTDKLPLISDIVAVGKHKGEAYKERQYGVKVLLREKAKRRSFHFMVLGQTQKHLAEQKPIEVKGTDPEQLSAARRERRRRSSAWEMARFMQTLMTWKSPQVASMSFRSVGSGSEGCRGHRLSYTDTMGVDPVELPLFIPLSLGVPCPCTLSSTLKVDEGKNTMAQLKNEMEAMGATLKATLREKQLLMARERASVHANTISTQNCLANR
ncbi:hypothetical protein TraAM80_06580 [Trypanosoma rangeli]|uniref:EF-hand domain-containing protein n=1 Tax=Trypanosoma rangeli TaxID=5698 RepID=A0A3R7LRT0_TRYRA|nr:uncharacterized protein TraAM80_06580 [Trypanosoma rangeli]RNF02120.1 hypothetical protein TraAM80_06580 [Trypanosoma rangeli]|eukprot:RNF02120.1 hypothetical protein TraAM80_06580 [Trypanosoma rangeli]